MPVMSDVSCPNLDSTKSVTMRRAAVLAECRIPTSTPSCSVMTRTSKLRGLRTVWSFGSTAVPGGGCERPKSLSAGGTSASTSATIDLKACML
eukprot:2337161-Rhodomonas_salina.1